MSQVIKTIIHLRICVYAVRRQAVSLYRLVGKWEYIYIYIYIYIYTVKSRVELQVHMGSDSEESPLQGCERM